MFFFVKQKTAYEMLISDWSSDVCSSDLAEYVSGLRVEELVADLPRVVPGRKLDDDCNILLHFDGKVPGVLTASQIATGERNGLRLRIYGEKGGIEWDHDAPGNLILRWPDARTELLHSGGPAMPPTAPRATRLPSGHPEGSIADRQSVVWDKSGSRPVD